jgi:lysine 2,3-aminomutase
LSLIQHFDPADPVFRMVIPQNEELNAESFGKEDPLGEEEEMPVPHLIRRYRDRALILVTQQCAANCRYCTRKRRIRNAGERLSDEHLQRIVDYLAEHPDIDDVILSGGDPLVLETEELGHILQAIDDVPSVEILRIGTRVPVTLPMRIDVDLVSLLKEYHPLFVNTHFNHPAELTPEAFRACEALADAGIPVGNQSVLLRGVNDNAEILARLFRGLLRMRVRPYYLFQCEPVKGADHFRTTIPSGMELMEKLRVELSGLALPAYVVDMPGAGKIPLEAGTIVSRSSDTTVLRSPGGMLVEYPEPGGCGEEGTALSEEVSRTE